jgi:hypothetical protein
METLKPVSSHSHPPSMSDDLYHLRILSWAYFLPSVALFLTFAADYVLTSQLTRQISLMEALITIYLGIFVAAGFSLRWQRLYFVPIWAAYFIIIIFPLGTVLGIATIVVLRRPSVRELFHVGKQ